MRPIADAAAVEAALSTYLNRLAGAILNATAVGLFRLTVAEASRFPGVAQSFFREGALRHINQLAGWLEAQAKAGLITLTDPVLAARILTSFIILDPLRAAAMGLQDLPSPADMDVRVRMVTGIFINGCAK